MKNAECSAMMICRSFEEKNCSRQMPTCDQSLEKSFSQSDNQSFFRNQYNYLTTFGQSGRNFQKNILKFSKLHILEIFLISAIFFVSQTIDWVMRIEDSFFPVIAGELGPTKEVAERYQQKLKEFLPTVKVYCDVF
jgi:hypothetical protein